MSNSAKNAWAWLVRRPSYLLLMAPDERAQAPAPDRLPAAWLEIMVFSLLWALVSMGVWSGTWRLFGDYGVVIVPAVVTLSLFALVPYRRAVIGLAEIVGGKDATARAVVASLLVVVLALCLVRVRPGPVYGGLRLDGSVAWLLPEYEVYRVLLVMPLWGGWSMLITCQFCKPTERTAPVVAAIARNCGPLAAAGCMGAALGISIVSFSFLPWTQLSISGCGIFVAIFAGAGLCRASGGLNRKALLATNLLTQIAVLLAYLANSR